MKPRLTSTIGVSLFLLTLAAPAPALDLVWEKTAGNSSWSTAANWRDGVPPSTSRTTDTLSFFGGSTFGGPVQNDITNLQIAELYLGGSFSGSSARLTGQMLRLVDLTTGISSGSTFTFQNAFTLTGTPSFGWDLSTNPSSGSATVNFEGQVDAGPFVLDVRGRNFSVFKGGITASSRGIENNFLRVECIVDGTVQVDTPLSVTGQVELARGRLIMHGAPQSRVRITSSSSNTRIFECEGTYAEIRNFGGSVQFLGLDTTPAEVTSNFTSGDATGGIMVFRPYLSGTWKNQRLILKGSASVSQTILAISPYQTSGISSVNAPPVGTSFTLIDRQISGSFSGQLFDNVANNGFIANSITGDVIYRLSQNGGDGNDVTITRVATSSAPLPVITGATVTAIAGNTTQRRVTITGKALPFQRIFLQSSATTTGFTDLTSMQGAQSNGSLSFNLTVPIATPRQFYRFRTVAAP